MSSPTPEILILGRQITDPRLYQAFKEVNDKLELLLKSFVFSEDGRVGFGFSPAFAAMFDLNATGANDPRKKTGLGLNNVTLSDKLNITMPPAGLILYDSTTNKVSYYNGVAWVDLGVSSSNLFSFAASGQVGSASGSVETTLFSMTLPAGFLNTTKGSFSWSFIGGYAADGGGSKKFRVSLGSTILHDQAVSTLDGVGVYGIGEVVRITDTSGVCNSIVNTFVNDVQQRIAIAQDFTTPLIFKLSAFSSSVNGCVGNLLKVV